MQVLIRGEMVVQTAENIIKATEWLQATLVFTKDLPIFCAFQKHPFSLTHIFPVPSVMHIFLVNLVF